MSRIIIIISPAILPRNKHQTSLLTCQVSKAGWLTPKAALKNLWSSYERHLSPLLGWGW